MEAARDAHAICVLTEWDEFKAYDYQAIYDSMVKPAFIFDGRNILDHAKLRWVAVAGRLSGGAWVVAAGLPHAHLGLFTASALQCQQLVRSCCRRPGTARFPPLLPLTPPAPARPPSCREIGYIVYAIGKPLDPFLQKHYD